GRPCAAIATSDLTTQRPARGARSALLARLVLDVPSRIAMVSPFPPRISMSAFPARTMVLLRRTVVVTIATLLWASAYAHAHDYAGRFACGACGLPIFH